MRFSFIIGIISFIFLAGCDFDFSSINFGVLSPMGEVAIQEKELIIFAFLLMLIVIIPAVLLGPIFAWKYRAGGKGEYHPEWAHSVKLEVIWWGIPCIIILILGTVTWITTHKLDPYRPLDSKEKPIRIQVVALDWKWLFIYPEYNIATVNFIQFPVDVPVNFEITADAPMNSFMLPQLGGQIYAMEGMTTKIHLIANKAGEFRGFSANYSGTGFSGMKFIAKADTKEEFEKWIREVKNSNSVLSLARYNKLAVKSQNNKVEYFSSVENNLFDKIIKKFMPMGHGMKHSEVKNNPKSIENKHQSH
jgi:cytochrome o ubiquinol oxidase subunit 2